MPLAVECSSPVPRLAQRAFTRHAIDVHKTPGRRTRDAAEQLEPLGPSSLPLVGVLASPHAIWIGIDLRESVKGLAVQLGTCSAGAPPAPPR
jgi:hypothetical protein